MIGKPQLLSHIDNANHKSVITVLLLDTIKKYEQYFSDTRNWIICVIGVRTT